MKMAKSCGKNKPIAILIDFKMILAELSAMVSKLKLLTRELASQKILLFNLIRSKISKIMNKLVILEISKADIEQRYPVTLRIGDSIHSIKSQISGYLPPAKDLRETYQNLQKARDSRGLGSYRKFEQMKKGKITKISVKKSADCVKNSVNDWLNSKDECFSSVQEQLLEVLITERGNVRLMIQTDDVYLWRLPWHLWNKFERFKIEPFFSRLLLTNTRYNFKNNNSKNKIKILVILGDCTDIDVQADLVLLKESIAHNDAEIKTLVATSSSKLNNQLWEQNWDILFFAGHSSTEDGYRQGQLALSETESIDRKSGSA